MLLLIRCAIEPQPAISHTDLRTERGAHGVGINVAGLLRFFARRRITLNKVRACPGAEPPRRSEASVGVVPRPARPRSASPVAIERWAAAMQEEPARSRPAFAVGVARAETVEGGLTGFTDEHRSILWGEREHAAG